MFFFALIFLKWAIFSQSNLPKITEAFVSVCTLFTILQFHLKESASENQKCSNSPAPGMLPHPSPWRVLQGLEHPTSEPWWGLSLLRAVIQFRTQETQEFIQNSRHSKMGNLNLKFKYFRGFIIFFCIFTSLKYIYLCIWEIYVFIHIFESSKWLVRQPEGICLSFPDMVKL